MQVVLENYGKRPIVGDALRSNIPDNNKKDQKECCEKPPIKQIKQRPERRCNDKKKKKKKKKKMKPSFINRDTIPDRRRCVYCGQDKPIKDFEKMKTGTYRHVCNACKYEHYTLPAYYRRKAREWGI